MDHELALKTRSAEKYLIGDLRPRAREAFEQHFFECEECAEEVRMGFQFRENLKAVFREEPATVYQPAPPSRVRGWFAWMNLAAWGPKAAMAAVAALCVYQNAVQIPALKTRMGFLERPAVLSPTSLSALSRSAAPTVKVSSAAPFFQLSLAIGSNLKRVNLQSACDSERSNFPSCLNSNLFL